jgi:DNA repair exonuclease SbcCD ATPase subunit
MKRTPSPKIPKKSDNDDLEDQLKRLKSEHSSAVRLLNNLTAKIEGWDKEEEEAKEEAKNKENSAKPQPDITNVQSRAPRSNERAAARSPRSKERAAAGVVDADCARDTTSYCLRW